MTMPDYPEAWTILDWIDQVNSDPSPPEEEDDDEEEEGGETDEEDDEEGE